MRPIQLFATAAMVLGLTFGLTACRHSSPNFVYAPDMHYSPAIKPQEEGIRMPPAGSVPRGFYAHTLTKESDLALAAKLENPIALDRETLARGQVMFNSYCMVCHGPAGEGDGTIVPKYPQPPTLQSDKIRGYEDGKIYHIITVGQNLMPSYAGQIDPDDRWKIVHYLHALHRAKRPTDADLEKLEALRK